MTSSTPGMQGVCKTRTACASRGREVREKAFNRTEKQLATHTGILFSLCPTSLMAASTIQRDVVLHSIKPSWGLQAAVPAHSSHACTGNLNTGPMLMLGLFFTSCLSPATVPLVKFWWVHQNLGVLVTNINTSAFVVETKFECKCPCWRRNSA